MKKTILVTGAAGFIGSHIVDKFIANGYFVIAVDNLKTGNRKNINPKALYVNLDLNKHASVKKVLKKYKPQKIIHHASNLVDVELSVKNPVLAYKDVAMTVNLIHSGLENGLEHFIFSSSANVYGNKLKQAASELFVQNPSSPYGLTKQTIERFILYATERYKMQHTIFRYFNVYGERQNINSQAAIPTFIKCLMMDQPIELRGGDQLRDFIYVKDVAQANFLAAKTNESNIFNIGSGKQVKIKNLVMQIGRLMKKKPTVVYINRDVADSYFSGGQIKSVENKLKWKPETSLKKGLKKTIEYHMKNNIKRS